MVKNIKFQKEKKSVNIIREYESGRYLNSLKQYESTDEYLSIVMLAYMQNKEYKLSLDVGVKIENPSIETLLNLAGAAVEINSLTQALHFSKLAILQDPTNHQAYNMLGLSLMRKESYLPAIQAFLTSTAIHQHTPAMNNLASCYSSINQFDKAIDWYIKVLDLEPQSILAASNLMLTLHYSENYDQGTKERIRKILAEIYTKQAPKRKIKSIKNRKIKLGFISPDFKKHSVSYFFMPFLEEINKDKYEIYLFSTVTVHDDTTERYQSLADYFFDVKSISDFQISKQIKSSKIDILFDLCGHTSGGRLRIFSYNPAPISISWIGFPGKTANPNIDYFLVDKFTNPENDPALLKLPTSFLTYKGEGVATNKEKLNLEEFFLFGSFNNIRKINDRVINVWAQILKRCPNSKLLVKTRQMASARGQKLIVERFEAEGVDESRLLFAGYAKDRSMHLDHYRAVDLALDSFPYNGTTTTCETLVSGTPVLSLEGNQHVSRVGSSLLSSLKLENYIAEDEQDYIMKAIAIYESGAERLWDIDERFSVSALGNAKIFCKDFDKIVDELLERNQV